ncbi:SbcC/MukB-like Walker B domain-containing protein [Ruegeria sp. HKCCE4150]|uniref:SbcC/MukB-like Walker B domain-containing protein n=1 Tax=Ruegeria sp. HKCCE4150 TaxID=2794828 RepID=UPI001AEA191F|nr:SbcC/MukB-like Walker B domain-containing protein [Ruegeria sp. HKCCE4150]
MFELKRISAMNWNLLELEDIEIDGITAIIGMMGSGKSTLLDAIQTVKTGNQVSKLSLNRAASSIKSTRSVKEYCLGVTEDTIRLGLTRDACHSILVLSYRDDTLNAECAVGLTIYADKDEPREHTTCRFIAEGTMFSFEEFADREPDGTLVVGSPEIILERVREKSGRGYSVHNNSARGFIENYLRAMRPKGATPNADDYIRRFRNAIAFQEIKDPTEFVRTFVLDEDPIQTDRLRANLQTWDEISASIETLKKKIGEARSLLAAYASHAEWLFTAQENAYQTAWSKAQIAAIHSAEASDKTRQAEVDLAELTQERTRVDQQIEREERLRETKKEQQIASGYSQSQALLQEKIGSQELVIKTSAGKLNDILKLGSSLRHTDDLKRFLPMSTGNMKIAAERLEEIRREFTGSGKFPEDTAEISRLIATVKDTEGVVVLLNTQYEDMVYQQRQAEEKRTEKLRQLRSRERGGKGLDGQVQDFIEYLVSEGIVAEALPMMVEVVPGMEDWVRALETRLGAFKEAIYVDPKNFDEAYRVLRDRKQATGQGYEREHRNWKVRLINTQKLARGKGLRNAAPNAIVSILETDNDLIRKFLDSQFGGTVMVDTPDELKQHSDAIMKDGSQSQGFSVRVNRMGSPILGRVAQESLVYELQTQVQDFTSEIDRRKADMKRLQNGVALFQAVGQLDTQEASARVAEIEEGLNTLKDLERRRDEEVSDDVRELIADIKSHGENINKLKVYREGELEDRKNKLIRQQTKASEKAREEDDTRARHQAECDGIAEIDKGSENMRWRHALYHMDHPAKGRSISSLKARLDRISEQDEAWHIDNVARLRKEKREELDANSEAAGRRARRMRGIASYLADFDEDIELAKKSEPDILNWLVTHVLYMEDNELLKYQKQISEFREVTRLEVREVFMTKLNDNLKGALSEMRKLNKRIRRHKFEGMTYVFDWKIDPTMKPLYQMAQRVSEEADKAETLLMEGGDEILNQAVDIIREIFKSEEGAAKFEDYRQYFEFELVMTRDEVTDVDIDNQGVDGLKTDIAVTGNLTDRIGKGSGGQKQTPYYVAIAASMAAAYYPNARAGESMGMGLVCFDEAFNKLDIRSTQELIRLYRDLNLQILIAAPEEKRTSFMEVADTIVTISKAPGVPELFIDVEKIGNRTKKELRQANPEHLGVDGFRQQVQSGHIGRLPTLNTATEAAE